MKNYYIYFKEPFCVKAKNEDEALERFSDAIYKKNMSKKELWEVAMKGVEYWYSGKIDGTQWDCLMKGLEDWKNCRI